MNGMPRNRGMGILPMFGGTGILPMFGGMGILPMFGGMGILPMFGGTGILPMFGGTGILPMTTRAGFTAWKAVPREKPRRHRRQRSGWTLLEVSIVVTISSIVFMLAAVTLAAVFRVKVQMAGDTEQDVSIRRLASRLRTDAHDAVSARLADGCELMLGDGRTIRYTASPQGVVREVARSGAIQHRDAFRLPRRAKVAFRSHEQDGGQLVELSITAAELPDQSYAIAARRIEIMAAVNLHRQPPPAEAAR